MYTPVVILAPIFVVLLLLGAGSLYLSRLRRQAMQNVAAELGLRWRADDPGSPGEILGELEGLPVSVRIGGSGVAGFNQQTTSVEIILPVPLPMDGEIGLLRRVDSAARRVSEILHLGEPEHEKEVDDRFLIRADDPDKVLTVLDADARLLLRQFAEHADDILILPSRLRWYRFNDAIQDGQVTLALRSGVALADHFRRQRARRTLERARTRPPVA